MHLNNGNNQENIKIYDKLVRDKIPQIIDSDNKKPLISIFS